MIFPWHHRHKELDERLAEAHERADRAADEVETSAVRANTIRETIVKPLRMRAEQNQFGEMLGKSLQVGYGNGDSQ